MASLRRAIRCPVSVVALLGLLWWTSGAQAHPNHEEENDDLKTHVAQLLREIGRPCDNVIEIEESASQYVITCEITQEGVAAPVVYTVVKRH